MARILAIDYGLKRTGIAVTDPLQIVASGLETIQTKEIWEFFENYFAQEMVETMVVGEPFHLDGTPSQITPQIEAFIKKFKTKYPSIAIERVDERLTSVEAKQIIIASGVKKKKRREKGLVDKVSAILILQDFMESKRNSNL